MENVSEQRAEEKKRRGKIPLGLEKAQSLMSLSFMFSLIHAFYLYSLTTLFS